MVQRFDRDPEFRRAMLKEIIFALEDGDIDMARVLLRGLTNDGYKLRHCIVIDQPNHPVAAPCAITYCQYSTLKES